MDKKKLKEIIAIVIVGIVSIVSSVLACILGIPKEAIDNVINDVGFVEIFDPSFEEVEGKEAENDSLNEENTSAYENSKEITD